MEGVSEAWQLPSALTLDLSAKVIKWGNFGGDVEENKE